MLIMMDTESTCNINLDLGLKRESETETDRNHVTLRHTCATERDEVKFPFNDRTDSFRLLSVYRYAERIKQFLGWRENFRADSDAEENFSLENLSVNGKHCANDSLKNELDLSKEQKKNNCKDEKANTASESLSEIESFCSNDNQDIGLSWLFQSDNYNYQEKYKEKYENICSSNSQHRQRNSYYLEIKSFSDYLFENNIKLSTELYYADENDNSASTLEKDFEKNNCRNEIFRSSFHLDIVDSKTDKAALLFNTDFDDFILSNNKNTRMDKHFLKDNGTVDDGLILNDENSIIQDENETISFDNNEKDKGNIKNQLQDFIPDDTAKTDKDISDENVKCDTNSETNYISEQIDNFFSIVEQNITETQNDDLNQNKSCLELYEASVKTGNCKNIVENKVKENYKNNITNSKLDTPLKAYVQSKNDTGKGNLSKEIKNSEKQILEEYDEDTVCGLGFFRPRWLQPYATAKAYVILYSILGILHGSYYACLIGTLSTLEKRFSFKSKISGAIMIADEITPLFIGMVVGYYATKAHRPRIVALGMILSAGCCFVTSLPYFIYGPLQNILFNDIESNTGPEYCDSSTEICDADKPQSLLAVLLLITGSFLKGFGNLAYYAIGLAYLDDNSDKQSTPLYLAIALALRLLGPLLGFLMSSGFLKYYENPLYDPGFGPDDPRWIGAWWIGFFLQGVLLVIFTIPIAFFPRRLPSQKKIEKVDVTAQEEGLKELFRGMASALKRLGKNPVFIVLIIQTTMKIFGHFGHAIMLPKYMENQFRLSASEASLYSGAISIVCIIIATVLGGFLIWKFRPRIKVLLGGMIASETALCIGYLILIIPRCQTSEMLHFGMNEEGLILNSACNQNCDCSTSTFTPFCGPDGNTLYFSPCYAGCTEEMNITLSKTHKMNKKFDNCSCVDEQLGSTITEGFCPDENCGSKVIVYLIIYFFLVTLSNLFTVAATMILLRSVHPSDKSLALGTFETFICLFGFIPFPVTYGALVDSACLVWEKSCGETGNCWFYDMEKYSYLLHGASSLFCFLCLCCLITLYFFSSRIRDLYNEEDEEEKKYVEIKLDTVSGSVTKL